MMKLLMEGDTEKLIAILEQNRSKVDNKNEEGQSLLYLALCQYKVDVVMSLLQLGANVDGVDKYGNTPLHWAALEGQEEMAKILLTRKADVSARNKQGMTPLLLAAKWGRVGVLRLLLEYGASPKEISSVDGATILHLACKFRRVKAIAAILGTTPGEALLHSDVARDD